MLPGRLLLTQYLLACLPAYPSLRLHLFSQRQFVTLALLPPPTTSARLPSSATCVVSSSSDEPPVTLQLGEGALSFCTQCPLPDPHLVPIWMAVHRRPSVCASVGVDSEEGDTPLQSEYWSVAFSRRHSGTRVASVDHISSVQMCI